MKKTTSFLIVTGLLSATMMSPALAGKDDDKDWRKKYQEHYLQRHQMNMDMMKMLSETMTILRDLNHKPSAEEKARLSEMIKQLDEMMVAHKEMEDEAVMQSRHHKMPMMDDDERPRGRAQDWN